MAAVEPVSGESRLGQGEKLRPVEEALGRIAERLASLEKAGPRAEAGASHGRIQRRTLQRPRLGLPR